VLASFSLEGASIFIKAKDEAIRVHRDMGTGHLLLGLLKDYNGIASIVLRGFPRVTFEDARVLVDADDSDGRRRGDHEDSNIGYTQPVRRLLDQSLKEAQRLGAWIC
jgi:hypothetical protein